MTITRDQVADLQPGDVIRIDWPKYGDYFVRGSVTKGLDGELALGPSVIRYEDGSVPDHFYRSGHRLTVISRAPRPLYVNHPRTEPVAGDVARNADDDSDCRAWMYRAHTEAPPWTTSVGRDGPCNVIETNQRRGDLPARLRLLIDGETGQVVQS